MSDSLSQDQSNKSNAGKDFKQEVMTILDGLKRDTIIKGYEVQTSFNHKGYKEDQYLANFIIETRNNEFIVVNSSNSYRSDRIKGFYYDFIGIMQNWRHASRVVAYISVFPDKELSNGSFVKERERFAANETYRPVTHLFTASELRAFLDELALDIASEIEEDLTALNEAEVGSYYGKSGNAFEQELVSELTNVETLLKLKDGTISRMSFAYVLLNKILEDYGLDRDQIVKIEASNNIPKLLSGGNPKTDVLVTITLYGDKQISETISLKRTKEGQVSCHDYAYERFAKVLGCEGERLEVYFKLFQMNPSYSAFEAAIDGKDETFTKDEFKALLAQKAKFFNEWVLTGAHDNDNVRYPEKQISRYILIRTPDDVIFHTMKDYLAMLEDEMKVKSKYRYGVPFSWTYPSKQSGKRIQLKVPVLKG